MASYLCCVIHHTSHHIRKKLFPTSGRLSSNHNITQSQTHKFNKQTRNVISIDFSFFCLCKYIWAPSWERLAYPLENDGIYGCLMDELDTLGSLLGKWWFKKHIIQNFGIKVFDFLLYLISSQQDLFVS